MASDQIQFPIYKLRTLPDKLTQTRMNTENNTFQMPDMHKMSEKKVMIIHQSSQMTNILILMWPPL